MDIHKIQELYRKRSENFLALMLTLLGVIQGLALNHLADGRPDLLNFEDNNLAMRWVNFAACLFIIVRVFQTYYTAALDKVPGSVDTLDLVSIFGVGLLQYWVINSIECPYNAPYPITFRIAVLGSAAVALHIKTTIQVMIDEIPPDQGKSKRELIRSEFWNIPLSGAISSIGFVGWWLKDAISPTYQIHMVAAISFILVLMIYKSLVDARPPESVRAPRDQKLLSKH